MYGVEAWEVWLSVGVVAFLFLHEYIASLHPRRQKTVLE